MNHQSEWNEEEDNFDLTLSQRTEELYRVPNMEPNADGLIEAVVLSSLGGLVGIVLATGMSIGGARWMQVPFLFNPGINLLAFGFSAAIGVVFGYFPARRAARMDPIEALRHE